MKQRRPRIYRRTGGPTQPWRAPQPVLQEDLEHERDRRTYGLEEGDAKVEAGKASISISDTILAEQAADEMGDVNLAQAQELEPLDELTDVNVLTMGPGNDEETRSYSLDGQLVDVEDRAELGSTYSFGVAGDETEEAEVSQGSTDVAAEGADSIPNGGDLSQSDSFDGCSDTSARGDDGASNDDNSDADTGEGETAEAGANEGDGSDAGPGAAEGSSSDSQETSN